MLTYYIVLALGIIATVVFLVVRVREGGLKGAIAKSVASVLFIATALAALNFSNPLDMLFPPLIILALVLGLMGDVWLDLKWAYPADNDTHTFAGFISFGIGHIVYYIAIVTKYADSSRPWYFIAPLIAAIILAAVIIMLEKPMKLNYGKFKLISTIYAGVLILWTLTAGSLALMNGFGVKALNFMFAGGVLFLISDLILSGTYFGEGKNRPVDVITNHVSYYLAQFVIASSILFIK